MYFERENRKQQKNFFFGLFYNKAYNWILNISIGIIWEIFNIIIHITLWTNTVFHLCNCTLGSFREIQISYASSEIIVQKEKKIRGMSQNYFKLRIF